MSQAVLIEIAKKIIVKLVVQGGVWVLQEAWHAATRKPVLNFQRPPRIYDPASRRSFVLQANGTYRVVDGPLQD